MANGLSNSTGGAATSVVLEVDPEAHFENFDGKIGGGGPLSAIERLADPLREIAVKLQALGPVIKGRGVGQPLGSAVEFGGIAIPNIFVAARNCAGDCYGVTSWNAARTVYMNPKVYSSKVFAETFGRWGPILNTMDPPEHTKYRIIMQAGFSPRLVQKYEQEIIRPVIKNRLGALQPKGRADFVREFTAYFAYEIAGRIVGFSGDEVGYVSTLFNRLHGTNADAERAAAAAVALKDYAGRLIESRRAEPRDDLITAFINSEIDGRPVENANLVGLVINLMSGALDTVYGQSGTLIYLLLEHPEQRALVDKDRSLIPFFVEEALRFDGHGGYMARQAMEDTELEGVRIRKGEVVFLLHNVIDRDPSRWENPHVFDVGREPKGHIQFSYGVHSCIGSRIARIALSTLLETLLDDFPNLRWDPDVPKGRMSGWAQRKPQALPLVWDVLAAD